MKKLILGLISIGAILSGCSKLEQSPTTSAPGNNTAQTTYVQIERLGRPAINEGLIITNSYLNAFNSIGPKLDFSDAAAPVRAEALVVLGAVRDYALGLNAGLTPPLALDVALGFLPDVMRIDTSNSVPIANAAYASDFVIVSGTTGAAMLTGGRKLEDDVIDMTLSYLFTGDPTITNPAKRISDGVSYDGGVSVCANAGQGTNLAAPGHRCLHGAIARNASAVFPFLAAPH